MCRNRAWKPSACGFAAPARAMLEITRRHIFDNWLQYLRTPANASCDWRILGISPHPLAIMFIFCLRNAKVGTSTGMLL